MKKELIKCRTKEKPFNDPNSRSLLVSGPPGVGKTSAIRLIANSLNYDTLELNASDVRNKQAIEDLLKDLC